MPKYIVSSDKKAVVKKLKDLAKKAETVWLASDEDREGEAIAWHLTEQLKLKDENTKRIVFNSITKKAKDVGAYRTPTLRNVTKTEPWMHNGFVWEIKGGLSMYNAGMV